MEILDLVDENGDPTGRTIQRNHEIPEGFYIKVVGIWMINQNNEILIQKRSANKIEWANMWSNVSGVVSPGETTDEAILREVFEEVGIPLDKGDLQLIKKELDGHIFHVLYLAKYEKDLKNIVIQEEELSEAKWASREEIEELLKNDEFIKYKWEQIKDLSLALQYIGKTVKVEIDKPLGSSHPKYPDHIYFTNYGYVPNTISGDGEELDCYILGEEKPLKEYTGKCVAVIHRLDDNDDKLIIVPEGSNYTDEEIRDLTQHQERYFKSIIIRW